jgi:hypothetical protein
MCTIESFASSVYTYLRPEFLIRYLEVLELDNDSDSLQIGYFATNLFENWDTMKNEFAPVSDRFQGWRPDPKTDE